MPIVAIQPGEHLAEELEALDMSAAELARKLGVSTNRVTQILHGTRSVTGDTALRLGHFFGTSPQFCERYVKRRFYVVVGYTSGEPKNALPMCGREQERMAGQYVSESSG